MKKLIAFGINKYLKMYLKMKGINANIVNKFLTTAFCDFYLTKD